MVDENELNTNIYQNDNNVVQDGVINPRQEIYTATIPEDDIQDISNQAWPTLAIICIIAVITVIVIAIVKNKDKDKDKDKK